MEPPAPASVLEEVHRLMSETRLPDEDPEQRRENR
jgi:hypothetical protein